MPNINTTTEKKCKSKLQRNQHDSSFKSIITYQSQITAVSAIAM